MNNMNPKVDAYLSRAQVRVEEMKKLRTIVLDCGLTEDLKWGKPCYSFEGSNLVVIQGFKEYCALLFFKGVLLDDPDGVLVKTGENTVVGRQLRFESVRGISAQEAAIKAYIYQAIEVERSGIKAPERKAAAIPVEFKNILDKKPT